MDIVHLLQSYIQPMKLDLLFLVITSMLYLYPQQSYITGLFPSRDPLTHQYQCLYHGQVRTESKFHPFIGTNDTRRLNAA